MQRGIFRSLPIFQFCTLWSFYLDHSELGIMFADIPTITFEASVAMCQLCQLRPARDLYVSTETCLCFSHRRAWPRIARDEQARAILKTLLSHVATSCSVVTVSHCEVATRVATFASWVKSVQ